MDSHPADSHRPPPVTWDPLDTALTRRDDQLIPHAGATDPIVADIRTALSSAGEPPTDRDTVFQSLVQRLHEGRPSELSTGAIGAVAVGQTKGIGAKAPWRRQAFSLSTRIGIAVASVLSLAVLGTAYLKTRPIVSDSGTVLRHYATNVGQRATLRLADGTRVTLAPGTTVSLDQAFGAGKNRTVTLVGEAYFEVAAATGAPFIVRTGDVTTQVLGTAFDVKRYADDKATQIVVAHGKVRSIGRRDRVWSGPLTLTRGMVGYITDSTMTRVIPDDVSPYVGWTQGRLDFQRTPVTDALATMERWYHVRFQVADSALLTGTVTGSLDFQTTAEALDVLKTMLSARMTFGRQGDTTVVTLHARKGRKSPARGPRPGDDEFKPLTEMGQ